MTTTWTEDPDTGELIASNGTRRIPSRYGPIAYCRTHYPTGRLINPRAADYATREFHNHTTCPPLDHQSPPPLT